MLRNKYTGKQSSLTLYKSSSGQVRKLVDAVKLPSLKGTFSSPIIENYDKESNEETNAKKKSVHFDLCSAPISDLQQTTTSLLRFDSFRDLSPIIIEDTPSLPMADSPSFSKVFKRKIEACNQICSFADEEKEKTSIDRKTKYLTEIHKLFIGASPQSNKLSDEDFEVIFNMAMKNIVRRLPNLGPLVFVNEDVAPLTEPAWVHLQIAYQILSKILFEFPEAPFLTFKTIVRILRVSSTSEARERFQIATFISRFVDLRPEFLEPLINKFTKMISAYLDQLSSPFSVATIISAFHIILKDSNDVKPFFTKFFKNCIVPLIGDNYFSFFEQTLLSIVSFFIDDDPRNSSSIVSIILKKWPYTRISKQTTFLAMLMKCMPKMPVRELQPLIPKIFNLLANASDSECYKVAETAFTMWTTAGFERIINDNIKLIVQVFSPHIINAKNNHWSQTVRNNANFAISIISKRDPKFIINFNNQFGNAAIQEAERHLKNWALIARDAARKYIDFNLSKKLNEISAVYTVPTISKKGVPPLRNHRVRASSMREQPGYKPIIILPTANM